MPALTDHPGERDSTNDPSDGKCRVSHDGVPQRDEHITPPPAEDPNPAANALSGGIAPTPRAVAYDIDPESLASLRIAFPEWNIQVIEGATTRLLDQEWEPGPADLLVVGGHARVEETLGLCRGLRSQPRRAHVPLIVLLPTAQEELVQAVLAAGAQCCLVLPVHPKHLAHALLRALDGNQPGRHTLKLDRAQQANLWQDDGGEA